MKVSRGSCGSCKDKPAPGISLLLIIVANTIIAVSAMGVVAQTPTVATASPGDAAATRQRRLTTERLSKDEVAVVERPKETGAERRVFVSSTSLLVRGAVVEDKLLKRPEFHQLGFVITREKSEADLILELRHDLFTKYVFSVVDARTQTVLAGGKLSSLGGTVAGKVAKRFVKEMRVPGP